MLNYRKLPAVMHEQSHWHFLHFLSKKIDRFRMEYRNNVRKPATHVAHLWNVDGSVEGDPDIWYRAGEKKIDGPEPPQTSSALKSLKPRWKKDVNFEAITMRFPSLNMVKAALIHNHLPQGKLTQMWNMTMYGWLTYEDGDFPHLCLSLSTPIIYIYISQLFPKYGLVTSQSYRQILSK